SGNLEQAQQHTWTLWLCYGLLALSLDYVWGVGGIFSLGQTALFGLGAYTYAVIGLNFAATAGETLTALVAAAVVGALVAAAIGYFVFYGRLNDVYLALVTLAVTLVLFTVAASTADPKYHIGKVILGGTNGIAALPPLALGPPGSEPLPVTEWQLLVVAIVLAAVTLAGVLWIVRARPGRILAGIRENPLRMELLGYDVVRHRLLAFTLGGAIAGLAGGLYAAWAGFVSPDMFALGFAATVIIYVMVGGRGTLVGAFIGVVFVELATDVADNVATNQTPLVLGILFIAVVLALPGGVVPAIRRVLGVATGRGRRGAVHAAAAPGDDAQRAPVVSKVDEISGSDGGGTTLSASELRKSFGGVKAVDDLTVSFDGPGAHLVIGPNGAGKSTFFGMLSGRLTPTAGAVSIAGEDITKLDPHRRARRGMGIKLQVPSIFPGLPARENLWLGAAARRDGADPDAVVESVLELVGLTDRATVLAGTLSHGEQQWLEIGMVLAAGPSIVLLDEPTGGMTRAETQRTAELVRRMSEDCTVVVVEHDMAFVRQVGAPVTMLHQGALFRQGTFGDLRDDPAVAEVYLGASRDA
ncbi:MAG: urea transport system ATP-binding protein, partial [Solirubrobacteraceae bacterium]|nr:urea transport system ATP-binding protein [Solirubrobacteraceae bacterium]